MGLSFVCLVIFQMYVCSHSVGPDLRLPLVPYILFNRTAEVLAVRLCQKYHFHMGQL